MGWGSPYSTVKWDGFDAAFAKLLLSLVCLSVCHQLLASREQLL